MKTYGLYFALAVLPSTLASPILGDILAPVVTPIVGPIIAATNVCGKKGYDALNLVLSLDITGKKATFAACRDYCLANTACKAFAYGSLQCTLYRNPVTTLFLDTGLSPYTFYDRACPTVSPTTSTTSTISSTSSTIQPTTTTTSTISTTSTSTTPTPTSTSTTTSSTTSSSTLITSTTSTSTTSTTTTSTTTTSSEEPTPTEPPPCDTDVKPANPVPAGASCGQVSGGTNTDPIGYTYGPTTPEGCALDCVQFSCTSFGLFEGLCSFYGINTAALNVQPDSGSSTFYDASCYVVTECPARRRGISRA